VNAIFFILLFEKNTNGGLTQSFSIKFQHGPFSSNFVGAVGHEHLSSSEEERDRNRLRTTELMEAF